MYICVMMNKNSDPWISFVVGACTDIYRSLKKILTIDNFLLWIICIYYTDYLISGMIDLERAVIHTLGINIIMFVIIILLIIIITFIVCADQWRYCLC